MKAVLTSRDSDIEEYDLYRGGEKVGKLLLSFPEEEDYAEVEYIKVPEGISIKETRELIRQLKHEHPKVSSVWGIRSSTGVTETIEGDLRLNPGKFRETSLILPGHNYPLFHEGEWHYFKTAKERDEAFRPKKLI